MPFRFAASTTGPLATTTGSLALPQALHTTSQPPHHRFALVEDESPQNPPRAWATVPSASSLPAKPPQLDSIASFQPQATLLLERRVRFRAPTTNEVSALWTSLAAPLKTGIIGDICLDLDLGIQTQANWEAICDCWWSIERPTSAPILRVRLFPAHSAPRSINVKANAIAGLEQATRNAVAAVLGEHRTQLLEQLHRGMAHEFGKLPARKKCIRLFLEKWLALPAEVQAQQWQTPDNRLLAKLKAYINRAAGTVLTQTDQLTARLEFAAARTVERALKSALTALFDSRHSSPALLDVAFDLGANPDLTPVLLRLIDGDLEPLATPAQGLAIHHQPWQHQLNQRRTFPWRVPFSSGLLSTKARLFNAMESLDNESGRVVRSHPRAESERRTRHAANLLSIESAFATYLGPNVIAHNTGSVDARFTLHFDIRSPQSLQPILDLCEAGTVDPMATACQVEVSTPPGAIAKWLELQNPSVISRRLQSVWRTLLPLAVDMDAVKPNAAAALLVWASLPISTAARRTSKGMEVNLPGELYWDWTNPSLLEGMIWNPRTRAAIDARLAQRGQKTTTDEIRRTMSKQVLTSLLHTESLYIDRLTAHMGHHMQIRRSTLEIMRNLSYMLVGFADEFHSRLSAAFSPEAARVLGPLLLCSASPEPPRMQVTWTR